MELKGLEKTAIKRIASTVSKTSQVNDQSVDRLLVDIRNAAKMVLEAGKVLESVKDLQADEFPLTEDGSMDYFSAYQDILEELGYALMYEAEDLQTDAGPVPSNFPDENPLSEEDEFDQQQGNPYQDDYRYK